MFFSSVASSAKKMRESLQTIYSDRNKIIDDQAINQGKLAFLSYVPLNLSSEDKLERTRILLAPDGDHADEREFVRICAGLQRPQKSQLTRAFWQEGKAVREAAFRAMKLEMARADLLIESGENTLAWFGGGTSEASTRREMALSYARVAFGIDSDRYRAIELKCLRPGVSTEDALSGVNTEETEVVKDASERLAAMIGLETVKKRISEIFDTVAHKKRLKREKGESPLDNGYLHMFFAGNPGTGKTEVACIIGGLLRDAGVLVNGHVVFASMSDLTGQHVGETTPKVQAAIDKALDGVLFIDKAEQLLPTRGNKVAQEIISVLMTNMIEHKNRLVVVFATHPEHEQVIRALRPGLNWRIPSSIRFPDYSDTELSQIFSLKVESQGIRCEPLLASFVGTLVGSHRSSSGFGNAETVDNLVNRAIEKLAVRRTREMRGIEQCGESAADRLLTKADVDSTVLEDPFLSK